MHVIDVNQEQKVVSRLSHVGTPGENVDHLTIKLLPRQHTQRQKKRLLPR